MKPLMIVLSLSFFTLGALAAEASTAGNESAENRQQRDMNLLARSVAPESVVWLEAGGERVLALFEADRSGHPQGAVLLLHDAGRQPTSPGALENIRTTLPHHGWATLSTSMPPMARLPVPERTPATDTQAPPEDSGEEDQSDGKNNAEAARATSGTEEQPVKAEEGETEEIFDPDTGATTDGEIAAANRPPQTPAEQALSSEKRAALRLRAALDFLQRQNLLNIVLLGDGVGAARAGAFLQSLSDNGNSAKPVNAMVMIDARNRIPLAQTRLPQCLSDPEMPILDIYTGTDLRGRQDAQQRQDYARRNRFTRYLQIRLTQALSTIEGRENRIARRVRGFLEKYAEGMERKLESGTTWP